jgi:hypothetical protein
MSRRVGKKKQDRVAARSYDKYKIANWDDRKKEACLLVRRTVYLVFAYLRTVTVRY